MKRQYSPPRPTILIVDDQEQNLHVVGTMLAQLDYEIIPALSGEQAFQRLAARTPDLILLDVLMPDMDGIEVCRRLQADARWSDIPIIFLSASDDKAVVVEALTCGGSDYVTKPFHRAELLSRVKTHLTLKQTRDQLRALAEDKDELFGMLAHEIKNHLSGMTLSASLLRDRSAELSPKSAILVENMLESTNRTLGFLRQFLANQSIDSLVLEPVRADLRHLVQTSVQRYEGAAAAKRITLCVAMPPDTIPVVIDTEAFAHILENLIANALKFSPVESSVRITAAREDNQAICRVKDEGPGFTAEDRTKLFRRYARLSARPTAGEPSTGLGLSIAQRITRALGGTVRLESAPGKGAEFILAFPLA